jgi:hypothetical protein
MFRVPPFLVDARSERVPIMASVLRFRSGPLQVTSAKHVPGKLRNPQDPNGGRWEDSYYIDAAYMGGTVAISTRALDCFQVLKVGESYVFAGDVSASKNGLRLVVDGVFASDGKTPLAGMPEAAAGRR